MGRWTGWSDNNVERLQRILNNKYKQFINQFNTTLKISFIEPIGRAWASQDAVDYLNQEFSDNVNRLVDVIGQMYEYSFGIIEKARWAWSSTTNTDIISCPFEKIALSLDVSCIKENINGVRGIDKQDVMNCVSNLKEMMGSITADCLDFVNKEVSDIGFYDYNDVVAQIFRDRMRSTEKMASTLIHSFEIGINNKINNTVQVYGDVAGKIAQNFADSPPSVSLAKENYEIGAASYGDYQNASDAYITEQRRDATREKREMEIENKRLETEIEIITQEGQREINEVLYEFE